MLSKRDLPKKHQDERSELGFGTHTATTSTGENDSTYVIPSRPRSQHFDSLQQLLEDAGYKETRVFTPIAAKTPASPPLVTKTRIASRSNTDPPIHVTNSLREQSEQRDSGAPPSPATSTTHEQSIDAEQVVRAKTIAANSSWFNVSWSSLAGRGSSSTSASSFNRLRKKHSEPVLPKRTETGPGRTSSWWRSRAIPDAEHMPSTLAQQVSQQQQLQRSRNDQCQEAASIEQSAPRPTLRHAPSTQHLWQASVRHHRKHAHASMHRSRSFPARVPSVEVRPTAALNRKQSLDGARLVSGVGVRAGSGIGPMSNNEAVFVRQHGTCRISLRQAFSEMAESEISEKREESTSRAGWNDSISSLADLEREAQVDTPQESSSARDTATLQEPLSPRRPSGIDLSTAQLFAIAAAPIVSLDAAVAMRNSGCLEFGASPPSSKATTGRLRKMRSVDALELALARMQRHNSATDYRERPATIPESLSCDSLTAEDFANAKTTELGSDHPESGRTSAVFRRCPTPTLVITSPTGVRPPQPLLLDGIEFEPRSVSPKGTTTVVRPVAKRAGWKLSVRKTTESTGSLVEHRGRSESSRALTESSSQLPTMSKPRSKTKKDIDESHLQAPTLRKRGTTKSCGNLRRSAERSTEMPNIRAAVGKLSMSEQIHALHRSVQERDRHANGIARKAANTPPCIPRSPSEHDVDDPFSDFVAVATKFSEPTDRRSTDLGSKTIDRTKMSPVPFDRTLSRTPLGQTSNTSNQTDAAAESSGSADACVAIAKTAHVPCQPDVATKTLTDKRSGIGLACLVDLDGRSTAKRSNAQSNSMQSSFDRRMPRSNGTSMRTQTGIRVRSSPASHLHGIASMSGADPRATAPLMLFNDENIDPYLDSPTARAGHRALKKRNSRPRVL